MGALQRSSSVSLKSIKGSENFPMDKTEPKEPTTESQNPSGGHQGNSEVENINLMEDEEVESQKENDDPARSHQILSNDQNAFRTVAMQMTITSHYHNDSDSKDKFKGNNEIQNENENPNPNFNSNVLTMPNPNDQLILTPHSPTISPWLPLLVEPAEIPSNTNQSQQKDIDTNGFEQFPHPLHDSAGMDQIVSTEMSMVLDWELNRNERNRGERNGNGDWDGENNDQQRPWRPTNDSDSMLSMWENTFHSGRYPSSSSSSPTPSPVVTLSPSFSLFEKHNDPHHFSYTNAYSTLSLSSSSYPSSLLSKVESAVHLHQEDISYSADVLFNIFRICAVRGIVSERDLNTFLHQITDSQSIRKEIIEEFTRKYKNQISSILGIK